MTDPLYYLADDLAYIEDVLYSSASYCFSEDLQERMDSLGLSAAALARRCLVSHTIVDRWRTGKARPNGKERFKELGMALGMDAEALNGFLLKNGYPGLYLKNPLDSAARLLLLQKLISMRQLTRAQISHHIIRQHSTFLQVTNI